MAWTKKSGFCRVQINSLTLCHICCGSCICKACSLFIPRLKHHLITKWVHEYRGCACGWFSYMHILNCR